MTGRLAARLTLAATLLLLAGACAEDQEKEKLPPAPYPHAAAPPAKQVAAVTETKTAEAADQPSARQESTDPAGRLVYEENCATCHAQGIAGAPRLDDPGAWEPRIAKGMETLYDHAVNGFQGKDGMMPPKGGNPSLSDGQVKAAVRYMVATAEGS